MRLADTLFSGMEVIGGFVESLMHIGILIVFFFQERLFKSTFMRQIYQIDHVENGVKSTLKKFDDEKMVSYVDDNDVLEDNFLRQIINYVLLRRRFTYGY